MSVPTCPECGAAQFTDVNPDWWRCDHTSTCRIGASEDGRHVADAEQVAPSGMGTFRRPTTDAERALLYRRGLAAPADSETVVDFVLPSVRIRTYPTAAPIKGTP